VGCRLRWKLAAHESQPPGHAFIAAVTSALRAVRPQMRLVWIADRPSLFQFLASLGVDFCIRVNAKTKIAWRGRNLLLSELAVKPGQIWLELPPPGTALRARRDQGELAGGVEAARGTLQEPWYVVTSLESPQQALAYYPAGCASRRAFGTGSSGLRQAAVSTVERMARLVVGLVLATLLALLGLFGLHFVGQCWGWLWLALQLVEQASRRSSSGRCTQHSQEGCYDPKSGEASASIAV
jgi:hypothetical protein